MWLLDLIVKCAITAVFNHVIRLQVDKIESFKKDFPKAYKDLRNYICIVIVLAASVIISYFWSSIKTNSKVSAIIQMVTSHRKETIIAIIFLAICCISFRYLKRYLKKVEIRNADEKKSAEEAKQKSQEEEEKRKKIRQEILKD